MKELNAYYKAIEDLTKLFCRKYFKDIYEYDPSDWVNGEIGGVIWINDYWFNMRDIENAIKFKATKKEVLEYYEYVLQQMNQKEPVAKFEAWSKYFRGFKK